MLTVEFSEPNYFACDCCGGHTTSLTRFVYKNNHAYAIYYATFADAHPGHHVDAVVSLGDWGEGADPSTRRAFSLRIRAGAEQYEVMVTGPDDCPWRDAKLIGPVLTRDEALAHPWLPEVFHISDHIVAEDEPVKSYLAGEAS